MRGRSGWLAIGALLAVPALGACERDEVASAQEPSVEDVAPPDRAPDDTQGETAERDSWGTGFEDDDTFGDTDALDEPDDASDDAQARTGADADSWGTGFEDDDTFGDTDAFDDDAFGDTEPLDREPHG